MNWEVFVTCAITGAGDTTARSDRVPVTPEQIADSAIEAARAGAAVVHIHVRDPETGRGARQTELYREVHSDIRDSMIAGIAIAHQATLATGNVRHFEDLPVAVVNPWTD